MKRTTEWRDKRNIGALYTPYETGLLVCQCSQGLATVITTEKGGSTSANVVVCLREFRTTELAGAQGLPRGCDREKAGERTVTSG